MFIGEQQNASNDKIHEMLDNCNCCCRRQSSNHKLLIIMAFIFSTISSDLIAFLVIFTSVVYAYVKYAYTYWKRRGVKCLPPTFPFGNFADSFLQRVSIGELVEKMYHQTKDPFVGIYGATRPTLLVRDSALIHQILTKDFQHFTDRGMFISISWKVSYRLVVMSEKGKLQNVVVVAPLPWFLFKSERAITHRDMLHSRIKDTNSY